jgi:DNA-binding HxlR family transcriptional regulator
MQPDATPERAVPEAVARFQEVCASPTRVLVLRFLLRSGRTGYPELRQASDGHMSFQRLHTALSELSEAGYVDDDAPPTAARKPRSTQFWAVRERIAGDFGATAQYLFGGETR